MFTLPIVENAHTTVYLKTNSHKVVNFEHS
jgi:hypothetical protein